MGTENDINWSFLPIKTGKCEICGELHAVEKCPLVDGFTGCVPDSPSLSYARLTLPSGLEVRKLSDGTKTVIATKSFSKGLKFGPFVAKTSSLIDVRIEFPIKVFLSEEESVYLETYEEVFCNWMCLVLPATCVEEQNLICFQIQTSIYFCSLREIKEGEEFRVWYSPYYATKMGVRTLPRPLDLIHSSDEEYQEIFESLQSGVEMQDHQYVPKLKKLRRPPKKLVLGENYYREVPPNDVLPGELLGAKWRKEWECLKCGQVEHNVAAYARHLMTHYLTKKKRSFRCPYCNRNFRKEDGANRHTHLGVCRRKKLKESPQSETSNLNRMTFIVRNKEESVIVSNEEATSSSLKENQNYRKINDSLWIKSDICDMPNDNSNSKNSQIMHHSVGIYNEKGLLCSEALQKFKVGKASSVTSNSKNMDISKNENEWSIPKLKVTSDLTDTENVKSTSLEAVAKPDKVRNEKSFEHVKNSKDNLDGNILVKSHLNPPILDLSDGIDFHLPKSLDEIINDDCQISMLSDKSLPFNKNQNLDLFGSVESNLLSSDITNPQNSPVESASFYSSEKNGFLQSDFGSCNDVTDEERNKIVENFFSETSDKFYPSDYEMTDGSISENPESHSTVGQISIDKEDGSDKQGQSKMVADFKCDICGKGFTKPLYLYRHLRKHTGEFRCNTCFMVFARNESLKSHRCSCPSEANTQQTMRRVRVICKFCQLQFHSITQLKEHMDKHYCNGNTWQCTCKEVSDSPDVFLNHKCNFNKPQKSCTKCGKKFKSLEEFVEHKNYPISKARRKSDHSLLCEICGVVNISITGARLHRYTHGEPPHMCSVCDKRFSRLDYLKMHMQKHTNAFMECSICFKRFSRISVLINHQKLYHTDPAFTCEFCDKKFYQKSNYKRHLKTHNVKLNCSHCDMIFNSTTLLDSHLKAKHNNMGLNCDECKATCTSKWAKNQHRRKCHTGMYKCAYCNIEVRFMGSLRRHLNANHEDKINEWCDPKVRANMLTQRTPSAQEADLLTEQAGDGVVVNTNPIISNSFQTSSNDIMKDGNINIDTNVVKIESSDTQQARITLLTNTNCVKTILEENVGNGNTPPVTFDINILGSDNVSQLVSVDGEILSMPLTFINNVPSSPTLTGSENQNLISVSEEAVASSSMVLPEGYVLTLDNSLVTNQLSGVDPTLINCQSQDVSGTTSAYILTDELVTEPNIQPQNNVLFYIVDTANSDVIE